MVRRAGQYRIILFDRKIDTKEKMNVEGILKFREKLIGNLEKVILGKRLVLDQVIMGLLCHGHLLIEDVPGTGKTILALGLAKSIGINFSRIQFTPDMLPSDVTGVSIYNQSSRSFEFRPGPIFSNIILADEINRATPKTQSALLEAMEEKQITVDGITHSLPNPFMVIATQNPIEYEGTFNLPEAQLDRFLLKIGIGYPTDEIEKDILRYQKLDHPIHSLSKVIEIQELEFAQDEIKNVHVSSKVEQYIVDIINKTRKNEDLYLGASPRGSLALFRLGQCQAVFDGRDFVIPDDIKKVAAAALRHRIILQPSIRLQEINDEVIIDNIIQGVRVPGG